MRERFYRLLFASLMMLSVNVLHAQSGIQYVYDDISRLIAVIDPNGDTATYTYDAVGNILSIGRHSSSQVSIISFAPGSGSAGTTVTIYGTGFSATASQNTVNFNGTNATVSSATTTQLVVTVPTAATTGTIGVTAPSGSATSTSAFTIATATTPTITSFTPAIGLAGTTVTVTGTNFDTVPANDRTKLNATFATVSAVTATSLTTAIPAATGSGPITITTPAGTATSASDLFVPPAPFTVADVEFTNRLAMGTAQTFTITTANKLGLVTFAGTAGQRISLKGTNGLSGPSFGCDLNVSIRKPNNTVLVGDTCMEGSGFIDATTLPTTGTYTIVMDPAGTATGSVTLTLYTVTDVNGTITAGGSAVTTTTTTPGQNAWLTFSGTAGRRISLVGTNGMSGQNGFACDVNVSILNPDTSVLAPATCMEGSGFIDTKTLPATGTYTITVDPGGIAVGSLTLALYDVVDVSGTITPGGSPVTVTTTTPGQNATLTFSGSAAQRISLVGTNASGFNQTFGCDATVTILKPDASTLASACMDTGGYIDLQTLAATGAHTIVVDPAGTATGSLTLTLNEVPSDVTGTITPGGAAVTVTMTTAGQNATFTFTGTGGQKISLLGANASGFNQTFGCDLTVSIRKPDASALASTCMDSGGFIDAINLPASGTYTILVDPAGAVTGSVTLTLYTVADLTGSIVAGGSALTVTTATPGQNGSVTFSGTAGQRISLQGTNASSFNQTFSCDLNVTILKPDASALTTAVCMDTGGFVDATTLPATGTYSIALDPYGPATGSITLTLYDVPADPSATVTVGGATETLTTTTAGQNAQATFSGTSGQQATVHLTSNSIGSTTVKLLKPDGSQLTSSTSSSASFNLTTQTLPTTGTYTIAIDPSSTNIGSITVNVTNP